MQQQAKETSIELYPNPNTGKFFVRNAGSKILQVYDINGRLIHHTMQQVDEKTSEIQLNTTTAEGIYFVRILDANGQLFRPAKWCWPTNCS